MGWGAYDHVCTGIGEGARDAHLRTAGARLTGDTPVQVDHRDLVASRRANPRQDAAERPAAARGGRTVRGPRAEAIPGLFGPASHTALDPSRGEASAAKTARFVPLTRTRYGVRGAAGGRPGHTIGT